MAFNGLGNFGLTDNNALTLAVNVSRFNTVPIMDSVAKMNTGMNVEATVRKTNVLIY